MPSWQILIVGSVVGAFAIAHLSDAIIHRKALLLEMSVRQRIYDRESRAMLWWRAIDAVAIVLLILGVLKVLGMVVLHKSQYGMPLMASGIALYSVAAIIRAWSSQHAYSMEAPGSPASSSARAAALLTTVAQVALAGVVCWYVFAPKMGGGGGGGGATPAAATKTPKSAPAAKAPAPEIKGPPWLDEGEAVKLLGRDSDYLEVLVRRGAVRVQVSGDKREYLRVDIVSEKEAGLPGDEEVADELKQVKADREKSDKSEKAEAKDALKE